MFDCPRPFCLPKHWLRKKIFRSLPLLLHCTREGIFWGCNGAYFETFLAGGILYIARPSWHIVYCEGVKRGQGKSKWARPLSYVSQAPPPASQAPPLPPLPRQHFPSRIITKTQCSENMFVEDAQGQQKRTKAKCVSHSLTQKLPLLRLSNPAFLTPRQGKF